MPHKLGLAEMERLTRMGQKIPESLKEKYRKKKALSDYQPVKQQPWMSGSRG